LLLDHFQGHQSGQSGSGGIPRLLILTVRPEVPFDTTMEE
jgi:hypothetical protein